MDQVLVGLGDVDEDSGEKLDGVGQSVIVELVSGLGLVDEQPGVGVESQSGQVDGRAHEIAGELVQSLGVGGVNGRSIVNRETRVSPRMEEVDAVLRNQAPENFLRRCHWGRSPQQ